MMKRPPVPAEAAPRHLFLVAGLLGGLAFLGLTPPFQVPDEPAHFYRAYSVSEGRFLVHTENGAPGELLPSSLRLMADMLIASATALCLTKAVYFPLVLASFAIPAHRLPVRGRGLVFLAILVLSICAVTIAVVIALPSADEISYKMESRIHDVLSRPFHLTGLVIADYAQHAPRYGAEFIGRLGWLDTPLPVWFLVVYLAFLIAYTVLDSDPSAVVKKWQRIVLVLVVAASLAAISGAMYVLGGRVAGIQGRYFQPIALAAAWIFHSGRRPKFMDEGWILPAGVALLTIFSLVVTMSTIFHRYY